MKASFNPLDYPICFAHPLRLDVSSAWTEHVPFGLFVVDLCRPKLLVELGTQAGVSYAAFCQAVKALGLDTRCYAVDTWAGDAHTGYYGEEVLANLRAHHDPLYLAFSNLLQATFDDAVTHFADGSIDLLHIDGLHTYDAVKHDFETWRPKLSKRAVVMFHDTNVREGDFGVWRFWAEVSQSFPHFEFFHAHGLGVLGFGPDLDPGVKAFFGMADDQAQHVREFFSSRGTQVNVEVGQAEYVRSLLAQVAEKSQSVASMEARVGRLEAELAVAGEKEQALKGLRDRMIDQRRLTLTYKAEADAQMAEAAALRTELEKKKTEHEAEVDWRNAEIDTLTAEVAARNADVETLSTAVAAHNAEIERLKQDNGRLDSELQEARAESAEAVQSLQEHARGLQIEIAMLRGGLAFQLMEKYRRGLDRLLPSNTGRRRLYDRGVRFIGRLLTGRRASPQTEWSTPDVAYTSAESQVSGEPAVGTEASVVAAPPLSTAAQSAEPPSQSTTRTEGRSQYVPPTDEHLDSADVPVKLVAFYLPQFHPIPENDEWWGKGFTEWTNVARAIPQLGGQYQPHLPGELGFYDLRVPEVQRRQVELARQYGIHGFAFYYYWFQGKRLLERPLEQFVSDPEIDFPFLLCWANENWTRRWDGRENDVLIGQKHTPESDRAFIKDAARFLDHRNYIRIDGRPVLLVYQAQIMPDPAATVKRWKEYCQAEGLGEPYVVAAQTWALADPREVGFDAAVEFPPHAVVIPDISAGLLALNPRFQGKVFDYKQAVGYMMNKPAPAYTLFKTVMTGWDNTPRRQERGHVFVNSSPEMYRTWLSQALRYTERHLPPEKRLVFINAWNEWAEGTYLEPDQKYGYAYLQSTMTALRPFARPSGSTGLGKGNVPAPLANLQRHHDTAVIAHIYYPELWSELKTYLSNLGSDFDLFASLSGTGESAAEDILQSYPEAVIYRCENRGRDMAPFLTILSAIYPLNYKYVLKVHTKKTSHREDGGSWRQDLLGKLAGSPDVVREIKSSLESRPEIGIVAPRGHVVSLWQYMAENKDAVLKLAKKAGIHYAVEDPVDFVAGSMFWFKPAALAALPPLDITQQDFEVEKGRKDGTLAHALERFIGLAANKNGFQILQVGEAPETPGYAYAAPMPADYRRPVSTDPILLFNLGKVVSRDLLASLQTAYRNLRLDVPVYHVPVMGKYGELDRIMLTQYINPRATLRDIAETTTLKRVLDGYPDRRFSLICVIQEPVTASIDSFFYNLRAYLPDWRSHYRRRQLPFYVLQEYFLKDAAIHVDPERWFDDQVKPVFGIDVFASDFPVEAGYKIYQTTARANLLVIRQENLQECGERALLEFLGLEDLQLPDRGAGVDDESAGVRQGFDRIPLPPTYLERMYGSRYAHHFYTEAEIDEFRKKWTEEVGDAT